jgi:hypothetical protein
MRGARIGAVVAALAIAARAGSAGAQESAGAGAVEVHARTMELDARTRELLLSGDVHVDLAPFHLRADTLRLRRDTRGAVDVTGPGTLTFCPCLGAPLDVRFTRAIAAPPGDLILEDPKLDVLGAPVLWAPWFWLRSPGRVGLLAPDVAYRGADGVFAGEGVHVPWNGGDPRGGLDVRAGGYFTGGVAASATLATPSSTTRLAWDRLHADDGLTADARGAIESRAGESQVAWDADAIRGARGVRATTDVEAASRAFDRMRAESAWRAEGWSVGTALRSTSLRGGALGDVGASGPVASVSGGGALGGGRAPGAYDVALEGGALSEPARAVALARGALGVTLADRWGPFGASLAARGAGDVADAADRTSASPVDRSGLDGAASARARLALPLARAWAAGDARDPADANDPWIHRVEPAVDAAVLASRGDDLLGVAPGRGGGAVHGESWLGEAEVATSLGRWGARVGGDAAIAGGAIGSLDPSARGAARALLRARLGASSPAFALGGEAARVSATPGEGAGGAFAARARLGELTSLHVALYAAERDGVDPVAARALTDAPLEPSGGFLASEGWTAGGRARVPWTAWLATFGGADVDLTARLLVAASGGLELRDRCGCLRVRATASHRIGREGVDAWLAIDLAPSP